nr:PREDICTED: UNC93-like protein MFSD11 [Bemisia tabaci]
MDSRTINICGVGICQLLLFSGYFALLDLQKTLLASAHDDNPNFNVDGYTLSGVIYTSFSLSVLLTPSVISSIGPRLTMFIGALCYLAPPVAMFLENSWFLYVAVSLKGIGGALTWTASSNYLVLNSTEQTLARNMALFWFFFACGYFPGNLFTYFAFKSVTVKIDESTRHLVLFVMAGFIAVGAFAHLFLRDVQESRKKSNADTPLQALKRTSNIALSRNTAVLLLAFGYVGLNMSFISGIYGSSIGFTLQIGEGVKRLVPLSGVFAGCGEVSGGILGRIFGKVNVFRINVFFVAAVILNCICYLMIFLSLPADANFGNTYEKAFIEPRPWLLLLVAYFLGVGDSLLNIQMLTLVGSLYPHDSAPAFGVFKISRSVFTAASYYYSRYLPLPTQLLILTIFGVLGMITFNVMNVTHERRKSADKC